MSLTSKYSQQPRNGNSRILAALLIFGLVLAPSAANAGIFGLFGGSDSGGSGSGRVNVPVVTDDTVRRAAPGTRNLTTLVGGSSLDSDEDSFARNLQQQVGGQLLHGNYGVDDMVTAMMPGKDMTPLSNFYMTGHSTSVPRNLLPDITPSNPNDPYIHTLFAGQPSRDSMITENFLPAYDKRMQELGLSPRDVWAKGAQINLKPCSVAKNNRDFLNQLAERVPEDVTITAYNQPYNWSNFTQYPFGIRTGTKHLMGEQQEGLVKIQGRWKPEADGPAANDPMMATGPGGDSTFSDDYSGGASDGGSESGPILNAPLNGGNDETSMMLD